VTVTISACAGEHTRAAASAAISLYRMSASPF
jgi:hypothetical protein